MTQTQEEFFLSPLQKDLCRWRAAAGHPTHTQPTLPEAEWYHLDLRLIEEECSEFVEAHASKDLEKMAREAIDIVYVVVGALTSMGIDFQSVWDEVHRANMIKLQADGTIHRRPEDGKILKPPGFVPPDIGKAFARHQRFTESVISDYSHAPRWRPGAS